MAFTHNGTGYTYVIGSDLDRDGMYAEVMALADRTNAVLEVFYSDEAHEMTLSATRPDVPLEVVEWAIGIARKRLPPVSSPADT